MTEPIRSSHVGWWAHKDLNLGQTGYEPVALTAELWARQTEHIKYKNSISERQESFIHDAVFMGCIDADFGVLHHDTLRETATDGM
jgi:hypothetical protein